MPTMPSRHARKARKRDARPADRQRRFKRGWQAKRRQVILRDAGRCQSCDRVCGGHKEAHVDHIVPHAAGGSDALDNLQLLCASCHGIKTRAEEHQGLLRVSLNGNEG